MGEVERRAKDVVAVLWELADQIDDADEADALRAFAEQSERGPRLREIVKLAQSEPAIPLRHDNLDADPWLLNVSNGTLDLRTGDLREHRREDLITKLAPVDYAPDAPAPRWIAFLDEIFERRAELIEYVQRAVGCSITGLTTEQVLFFCSFLGLLLLHELRERMAGRAWVYEWERLKEDLNALEEIRVKNHGPTFWIRSRTRGEVGQAFQAVGVRLGSTVRFEDGEESLAR